MPASIPSPSAKKTPPKSTKPSRISIWHSPSVPPVKRSGLLARQASTPHQCASGDRAHSATAVAAPGSAAECHGATELHAPGTDGISRPCLRPQSPAPHAAPRSRQKPPERPIPATTIHTPPRERGSALHRDANRPECASARQLRQRPRKEKASTWLFPLKTR